MLYVKAVGFSLTLGLGAFLLTMFRETQVEDLSPSEALPTGLLAGGIIAVSFSIVTSYWVRRGDHESPDDPSE